MSGTLEHTIIDTRLEPIDSLHPYHLNPRRGDIEAISASLDNLGQFKAIVVNIGTKSAGGYEREILAGNHTWQSMRKLGRQQILVHWVDVDDDTAAKIVLNDNRTNDLATNDDRVLSELLMGLPDLDGVAYTPFDLEDLAASISLDGMDEGSSEPGEGGLDEHADNGSTEDADAPDQADKGKGLELWGVTVGEPDVTPANGSTWRLGEHVLVVADVHKDFAKYTPHMGDADLFWPYPSLLAPFVMQAQGKRLLMVQPNPYLAGWTITKWQRLTESTAVEVTA